MKANKLIMFKLASAFGMIHSAPRKHTGMPTDTHSAKRRRRNNAKAKNTRIRPLMALPTRVSIRSRNNTEVSSYTDTPMPGGRCSLWCSR